MATFLHLTAEDNIASMQRNGLKVSKMHFATISQGVFCMPVIDDFYATHQWLRELKRFSMRNIVGVYFKIPDDELVWCGHYHEEPQQCMANLAAKKFMDLKNRLGFEVILPRKVTVKEIVRIKHLPQTLGWRYFPASHERKPCLCPVCLGDGEFKSIQIRKQRYEELITKLRNSTGEVEKAEILAEIDGVLDYSKGRIKDYQALLPFLQTDSAKVIMRVILALANFDNENVIDIISNTLCHEDYDVKIACVDAIFRLRKEKGFEYLRPYEDDEDLAGIIREYRECWE